MLDIILKTFIREVADKKIKQTILKYMMAADWLLLRVYTAAKKAYKTKIRIARFREEK